MLTKHSIRFLTFLLLLLLATTTLATSIEPILTLNERLKSSDIVGVIRIQSVKIEPTAEADRYAPFRNCTLEGVVVEGLKGITTSDKIHLNIKAVLTKHNGRTERTYTGKTALIFATTDTQSNLIAREEGIIFSNESSSIGFLDSRFTYDELVEKVRSAVRAGQP